MARTTKKKPALTPEEKLAQALVPEAEQPYRVPENWCWIKWGDIGEFIAGSAFKNEYQGFTKYEIPFYKVGSLKYSDVNGFIYDNSNTINETIRLKLKASLIPPHSILFAKIGEAIRLNRRSINETACCIDNNMMAFVPKCLMRYAFFWSCGIDLYDYTNATTVPAIRKSDLEIIPFPLPPRPEQQRIVDRIESLFAKLDEAKEKAQAVVDGFEDRKAAILHKAFTGELTAEWRKKSSISISQWTNSGFEDCINNMQNGIAKRKGTVGVPYVVLRLANLSDTGFIEDDLREIVLDEKEQKTYELHSGDTLMIRVNGSKDNVGKQYLITDQKKWAFCDHIIRIRYAPSVLPKYMIYYSKSESYRQYVKDNMVSSAGQNTISRKGMKMLTIPLPPIEEQIEIVKILDDCFEKELQIKESVEQVIVQIDTMKKSILARAFRGELGTNDPEEESAVELVKRTL